MPTPEPKPGKCGARLTNGSGLYCSNTAGKGTDHLGFGQCKSHGGSTRNGRVSGARKRAEATVGELMAEAMVIVEGMPGYEQLEMAIHNAGAMSMAYRWLLDELPVESHWSFAEVRGPQGSRQRWVHVAEEGLAGPDHQGQLRLHAYEEGFRHWTKLHAELLKTAHAMGMEDRRQAFVEAQVNSIGNALRTLVEGLGHELDDPAVVPVVEQALVLITTAAA